MSESWQLAIVGICVAAAFGWVAREVWRFVRSQSDSGKSCGSCGSCPTAKPESAENNPQLPLVTLELKDKTPERTPSASRYVS